MSGTLENPPEAQNNDKSKNARKIRDMCSTRGSQRNMHFTHYTQAAAYCLSRSSEGVPFVRDKQAPAPVYNGHIGLPLEEFESGQR